VQAHLNFFEKGRRPGLQANATLLFTIMGTGHIRQATLKIVASSGRRRIDPSALKPMRARIPFHPQPKEMTVAIAVAFSRKP
jgi:protein TonB